MVPHLVRSLLWARRDSPGLEHFGLWTTREGRPLLRGTLLLAHEGAPLRIDYDIVCSPAWETQTVRLMLQRGAETVQSELRVEPGQRWLKDGVEIPAVAGCVDVDLSITPSTNLLPIRRLAPRIGETRDVTAAWIRFPDLVVEPLPQRYTRLAEHRFRYESAGGAFTAELEVDDLGLPVRYPPAWERVALTSG